MTTAILTGKGQITIAQSFSSALGTHAGADPVSLVTMDEAIAGDATAYHRNLP